MLRSSLILIDIQEIPGLDHDRHFPALSPMPLDVLQVPAGQLGEGRGPQ